MKTIVITGSTSGIGRATALFFAEKGYKVIATARNPQKDNLSLINKNIYMYSLDVTDEKSIQSTVEQIIKEHQHIDVLVNNAGYGLLAPFELTSNSEIKKIFATNVFGLMTVTKAFLPVFKKQKSGTIVAISSIGGLVTMPLNSIYHSTKYAIEGFMESLSYELEEFDIKVKLIEPGAVKTNFFNVATILEDSKSFPEYQNIINNTKNGFAAATDNKESYSTPEEVAQEIYQAVNDNSHKIHYIVGVAANNLYNAKKSLGDKEFLNLVKKRFNLKTCDKK